MASVFLIVALVLLPLFFGICFACAAYQAYKQRLGPVYDVERARNVESTRRYQRGSIELPDIQVPARTYFSANQYGVQQSVVSPVARVRAPSAGAPVHVSGGEGLVSYGEYCGHIELDNTGGEATEAAMGCAEPTQAWERGKGELEQPGLCYDGDLVDPSLVGSFVRHANHQLSLVHSGADETASAVKSRSMHGGVVNLRYDHSTFEDISLDEDPAAMSQEHAGRSATPAGGRSQQDRSIDKWSASEKTTDMTSSESFALCNSDDSTSSMETIKSVEIAKARQTLTTLPSPEQIQQMAIDMQTTENLPVHQSATSNDAPNVLQISEEAEDAWLQNMAEANDIYMAERILSTLHAPIPDALPEHDDDGSFEQAGVPARHDKALPLPPVKRANTMTVGRSPCTERDRDVKLARANTYAGSGTSGGYSQCVPRHRDGTAREEKQRVSSGAKLWANRVD
ncbi:hypothetical protein ACN47E_002802 [Coniothyrium glycines]